MLEQPLVFTGCLSFQFFNSPPSPNTVSEAIGGSLLLNLEHLGGLHEVLPLHWSPSAFYHIPCLGKQRMFRNGKYFNHVLLLTELIYFLP